MLGAVVNLRHLWRIVSIAEGSANVRMRVLRRIFAHARLLRRINAFARLFIARFIFERFVFAKFLSTSRLVKSLICPFLGK